MGHVVPQSFVTGGTRVIYIFFWAITDDPRYPRYRTPTIMLLLTPVRSEVFYVKTSLLLSKNDNNLISSSGERSCEIIIALSGSLGSRGTLCFTLWLNAWLAYVLASFLTVLVSCCPSSSSCRQFTFLWPGAKSCSIFLMSFWLPWIDIAPN
jgi:hypothetical protein